MAKSSYQKQKDKIAKMEENIRVLIEEPDSIKAMRIKAIHYLKNGMQNSVFSGSRKLDLTFKSTIIEQIGTKETPFGTIKLFKFKGLENLQNPQNP